MHDNEVVVDFLWLVDVQNVAIFFFFSSIWFAAFVAECKGESHIFVFYGINYFLVFVNTFHDLVLVCVGDSVLVVWTSDHQPCQMFSGIACCAPLIKNLQIDFQKSISLSSALSPIIELHDSLIAVLLGYGQYSVDWHAYWMDNQTPT